MPANFLNLPSELRNRIYELCLLKREPIWIRSHEHDKLAIPLFCVNKTVHAEASSFFYAQNQFVFYHSNPEFIIAFLGLIGRKNAGCIRYVHVTFFSHFKAGAVPLREYQIGVIANIQNGCANLKTLAISLWSKLICDYKINLGALGNPTVVTEILKLVDARFRAISSQKTAVWVYEDYFIRREDGNSHIDN